jgi:hypothetical protein
MTTTLRRLWAATTVTGLLLLTAACGEQGGADDQLPSAAGSATASDDPSDDPSDGPSMDPEDAMLKLAQCMREHGIDMPDPGPDGRVTINGGAADRATMEAAEKACQEYRDAAMPQDGEGPRLSAEDKQRFLDLAACMRERGWDFDDPTFGPDGSVQQRLDTDSGIDPEDPSFQADVEECHAENGLEPPSGSVQQRDQD